MNTNLLNKSYTNKKATLCWAIALTTLSGFSASSSADGLMLEEIIVTAQKRAQSLQDVPLSVNAVSGELINEMNMTGLDDLSSYVPNLSISEGTTSTNIYIRGFGSGANVGFEQSVGMYIDGVYGGRDRQFRAPFLDIERVEVLRGPQGILFGKNTIAGAINIATAKPTQEFEASVTAEVEPRYNQYRFSGVISGPLSEDFSGRLAVSHRQSDGFFENSLTGEDAPAKDESVVRGTLVWDVNENTEVTLKAEFGSFDVDGAHTRQRITESLPVVAVNPLALGALSAGGPLAPALMFPNNTGLAGLVAQANANGGLISPTATGDYADLMRQSDADFRTDAFRQSLDRDESTTDNQNWVLSIEHDIQDYTLTSITGYSSFDADDLQDVDFSPATVLDRYATQKFDQISQEFRIASPVGETLEYIAGLYFQTSELETTNRQDAYLAPLAGYRQELDIAMAAALAQRGLFAGGVNFGAPFGVVPTLHTLASLPGISNVRRFDQDSDTYAAFGQLTWHLNESVAMTFGLRYSLEEKAAYRDLTFVVPGTNTVLDPTSPIYGLTSAVYKIITNTEEHVASDELREEQWTPSLNVSWDVNQDVMLYASASVGYKGGGFNEAGVDDPNAGGKPFGFAEEKATSFEVGGKTTLLDGAARLNFAVFYTEFDDLQVSTFTSDGFTVGNAGTAISQGVEVDGMWRMSESLTLSGAAAYLDAHYKEFDGAPCTIAQSSLNFACFQDLTDKELVFSPEWSASLALDHVTTLNDSLELRTRLDVNFMDNYYLVNDLDRHGERAASSTVNLRVALSNFADTWELALVGKNLGDQETLNYAADTPLMSGAHFGYYNAPRTLALSASLNF
ncbi:TonB-dependent receptor [Pseudomaricurvus alkylphenolicus]|uniref:TonB-dependent receptor n=1 Tax=Pseudomaricurvus alkylphenolicus TaxID=1306991 RepID=UPI001424302D|nr:TonB-dependent receptor [Pseudomaricurvus alkylphenolicus]NIB41559.1 TonB-dependent receptor [Pseudomaricurvus alkylphenolicus]